MIGYKLVKIEARPAEVWRELKETANRLAEYVCEMVTSAARDAESVSGQRVARIVIQKGDFRISAERNTPFGDPVWPRVCMAHVGEGWGKTLPDRHNSGDSILWTHWPFKASQVRGMISALMVVSADDIRAAVDAALDDEGQ